MEHQLRQIIRSGISSLKPRIAPQVELYGGVHFRKDVLAGLTVAAIIIPNALGYAILAGLPPVMGLYAAIPAIMCAALWGSSSHTITAPVGIVSLLAASSLASFAQPLSPEYITLAISLALLTGIIQLMLGVSRLGILARLIPHSALVGFTNAAALLIALTQLPTALGITGITSSGIYAIKDSLTN
jgi:SulP family sulfate permease